MPDITNEVYRRFGRISIRRRMGMLLMVAGLGLTGCMPDSFIITPISANRALSQQVLYRESFLPEGKVAIVDVEGVIVNANRMQFLSDGEHPVVRLLEQLDKARRDPAVKAVVLRVNSPGGSVTASELMHDEVMRFRRSGKPVVTMMLDVAASGGYYIACATDEIMACKSTVTGSIGVINMSFDVTGTMAKLGAKAHTIKSGPMKGAGSPFEELTPEQRQVMQSMIDELYEQFVDVVDEGREGLSREDVVKLADGRAYTAGQALELGLIDSIGGMPDAIKRAKDLAGISSAAVVSYSRPYGYVPNYYAKQVDGGNGQVNLLNVDLSSWTGSCRAPFMYLWTGY